MTKAINVLIAEDEELLRNGMQLLIDSEEDMNVIGTAENGRVAIDCIDKYKPDLVLMDIKMPVLNGIECTKLIREKYPNTVILILTTFNEEEYIIEALAHGANGYLIKGIDFEKLLQTIRDAVNGDYLLPSDVASKLAHYVVENKRFLSKSSIDTIINDGSFTKREQEIITLLINRLSNKEIASELFVTEGTIKNYLTTIYEKLGVENRREAIELLNQ